jgi:hypothetical protein
MPILLPSDEKSINLVYLNIPPVYEHVKDVENRIQ